VDFSSKPSNIDYSDLRTFKREIDSLTVLEIEARKPKIFPFNPNFITDFKGYTLGMSNEEIDRLHAFRNKNKFVNSAKEFQNVTKISDSLLGVISPYFKFPEWVTNSNLTPSYSSKNSNVIKTVEQKIDLNKASARELQRINGIGEKLSDRIVKFRNSFEGGFIDDVQLYDIYGLSPEVVKRITDEFTVKTPRQITKIDINIANAEELVTIQHIDYPLAHEIINERTLREGYKTFDELIKVKGFPKEKLEIIKLYLKLE